jgi:hypothetical protein
MIVGADDALFLHEATPWDDAQALLEAAGFSDGLPLVPPTEARLARMLAGVAAPDAELAHLAPMFGAVTPQAVAYCAMLAGCVPAELPVVLAAALAAAEDSFNLLGIATTTGTPTVAVCVHGPVAGALGMNSGTNCLGPGNRANACIGRAVALVLRNIAGMRPETGDMATMGQPGKYGFAFAEGSHPWVPPLHTRRGLPESVSAVTVLGVSGTMEVLPEGGADSPEMVLRPMLAAMQGAQRASSGAKARPGQEQVMLIPAEMADILLKSGWGLGRAQDFLFGADPGIARSAADIHPIIAGGPGVKMTHPTLWMGGTEMVTRSLPDLRG